MRSVVVAALLAFVLTSVGASPAAAWLDAGELAAAGDELGVMHPPGMPGLAALLQVATILPLGPLGWRLALVSSACAAAVAALTVRILLRRGVHPAIACGAIAWLLVGMTLLRHSRGVEIYMPQLAALAFVADGLDPARPPSDRLGARLVATLVATWAIWCFAELRLLLSPVLLVVWVSALRARKPYAAWAPVVVAFGSACIFTIPLAAAREPFADWADPQSLGRLVDHLLAQSIRIAYADDMLPRSAAMWLANGGATIARLGEDLGPSGPILGVLALASSWIGPMKLADRRALATMTAWTGGSIFYAVGVNPMGGVDRQTGLVLAWCVVVLVAVMLDRWLADRPRLRVAVLPIVGTVLVVPPALRSTPDLATMASWSPHLWTREALAQLPTGAMLLTQTDDLSAGVTWARVVEGARPDVFTWPAQHFHKPPPPGRRREQAAVWDAVLRAGSEPGRIEAAIAAYTGPVAIENAGSGVLASVRFAGPFASLPLAITGTPPPPDIRAQIDRWLPHLPTVEDRRRLAVAIAEHTRGHVRRGGDLGIAISALQSSLADVDPTHVGSMITLGGLFDRMGELQSAVDWTRRALAIDPDRQVALLNLALYLAREPGLHPGGAAAGMAEAIEVAEHATRLRPWRPETWQRLAEVRAAAGDEAGSAAARLEAKARADAAH